MISTSAQVCQDDQREKDDRAVHVERMGEKGTLTMILGNAEVEKPRRKARHRWEDDINVNL